jgi:hypothetical protein
MPVARFDGVPLAVPVLKPTAPLDQVRAVLSMPGPVLSADHAEAPPRLEVEKASA